MDKFEALRTFTTGENFHLQHLLGAHREEQNGEHGWSMLERNLFQYHCPHSFTHWNAVATVLVLVGVQGELVARIHDNIYGIGFWPKFKCIDIPHEELVVF